VPGAVVIGTAACVLLEPCGLAEGGLAISGGAAVLAGGSTLTGGSIIAGGAVAGGLIGGGAYAISSGGSPGSSDNSSEECTAEEPPALNLVKANPKYVEEVTGENPEDIKAEIVGKGGSRYDLYYDKNTGELYVLRKGGGGEPQPTGLRLPRG
jgi:Bacterial toxin 33